MFAQPKKWPQMLVAIVALVFVIKNPEQAAHLINQAIDARHPVRRLARFVNQAQAAKEACSWSLSYSRRQGL